MPCLASPTAPSPHFSGFTACGSGSAGQGAGTRARPPGQNHRGCSSPRRALAPIEPVLLRAHCDDRQMTGAGGSNERTRCELSVTVPCLASPAVRHYGSAWFSVASPSDRTDCRRRSEAYQKMCGTSAVRWRVDDPTKVPAKVTTSQHRVWAMFHRLRSDGITPLSRLQFLSGSHLTLHELRTFATSPDAPWTLHEAVLRLMKDSSAPDSTRTISPSLPLLEDELQRNPQHSSSSLDDCLNAWRLCGPHRPGRGILGRDKLLSRYTAITPSSAPHKSHVLELLAGRGPVVFLGDSLMHDTALAMRCAALRDLARSPFKDEHEARKRIKRLERPEV